MTQIVCAYTRDPRTGGTVWIDVNEPGAELGGFEACGHHLWGSATARELGLVLLPSLSTQDLFHDMPDRDTRQKRLAVCWRSVLRPWVCIASMGDATLATRRRTG